VHCLGFEHSIAALRGGVAMIGFFIQRPIFASAIAVIMVLAGSICYFLLPVSQFPDITPPQVVVSAVYPGASAQVVADTVTTPLEQQINGVAGMTYMSSSSSNDGSSTITITFDVGGKPSLGPFRGVSIHFSGFSALSFQRSIEAV
jgi:multidrug efflux pump subunit AcrB